MARVLKESGSVVKYWLEPRSRRVEPVRIGLTDLGCKVLEEHPYRSDRGFCLRLGPAGRHGVLVDFGREVGGYCNVRFEKGSCRGVRVQAVESISHLKGPITAGTAAAVDRAFITHHFKPLHPGPVRLPHFGGFRYLWFCPDRPGKVELKEVLLDYTPHLIEDIDGCGYFLCSDDLLNRAWYAGLHTVEMCTVDPSLGGSDGKERIGDGDWVLIDGAKRDRLIWTGDISPMIAEICVSSFNTGAIRDSLVSLAEHQRKSGYIPACSPKTKLGKRAGGLFGDYVAWWVVCLYQYFLHTGDRETVRTLFPAVRRALYYLHDQCRGGLFRQTPFNMMEWCFTVFRYGKPAYTNVMYYWALNCASFLAYEIGEDDTVAGYVSRAFRLARSVERHLWDEKKGVFFDTTTDPRRVPQDANSLAVVSGLLEEPTRARGTLDYLRERNWVDWGSVNVDVPYYRLTPGHPPHNRRVFPFMNNFEALARFMVGDHPGAMELIRRCWGNMVKQEPRTTFWEWYGNRGRVPGHLCSLCHGWSAGVVPLLSKFVLGIRPAAVGYRKYRFDPRLGDLEWAEGRVPVPGGFIEARIERSEKGIRSKVSGPEGLERIG